MNDNELILKKIKTNQILLTVLVAITSLTLIMFIVAGFICTKIYRNISPIVSQLEELDVEAINSAMSTVGNMQDLDFEKIAEAIDGIDMDEFEKTLNSIDFEGIGKLISSIDVEEMTEAMDNLNKASEMLENVSEKVTPILKWFK